MDLIVKSTELGGHGIEYLAQDDFGLYPCPICGSTEHLRLLAEVCAAAGSAIESAFCVQCEHRYHRKFPNADWLAVYYRDKFDKPSRPVVLPSAVSQGYRRLRSQIGKLVRYGFEQSIPNRIYDFMLGVVKGDAAYYLRRNDLHRVLEVGCGNGDNLAYFRDKGFDVVGTEVSPPRLAECARKGLRVYPTGIDNFNAVNGFGPFDVVYSTHVLEHVIDINKHIGMLAELLCPGGFAYFETPDLSGESLVYQTHTIYHVHTFSLSSMLRLLARHGLQAVRVATDGNVQVLARKVGREAHALVTGRIFSDASLPYLDAMTASAPGDFLLEWDHYHMTVTTLADQRQIYQSGLRPLKVRQGPNRYRLTCHLGSIQAEATVYPVRFVYPELTVAPIWYKI